MQLTGIEEIDGLHHDEGIEDEGEVSGGNIVCGENIIVVSVSVGFEQSAASDGSSNDTIVPFVFRIVGENTAIKGVLEFRDEVLASKD